MDQLTRIEEKLDKVLDKQAEQSAALAVHSLLHAQNTKDLEVHIRRTNLLEERVKKVEAPVIAAKVFVAVMAGIATVMGVIKMLIGA